MDSEFVILGLRCLFRGALLWRDRDVVVGIPVVQHVVKILLSINLIPRHSLVSILSHFLHELVKLLAGVPVHVDSVDELAILEELQAGHALVGNEDGRLGELSGIRIEPCSNL